MLKGSGLTGELWYELWEEYSKTATNLHNLIVNDNTKKSPHELFYNSKPKFRSLLQEF